MASNNPTATNPQESSEDILRLRQSMKAYLEAPLLELRATAAKAAYEDWPNPPKPIILQEPIQPADE